MTAALAYYKQSIPFVSSVHPKILGSWSLKTNKKQEDIVTFWANSDHCGDVICGNPLENKKLLEENHKNWKQLFEFKNKKPKYG